MDELNFEVFISLYILPKRPISTMCIAAAKNKPTIRQLREGYGAKYLDEAKEHGWPQPAFDDLVLDSVELEDYDGQHFIYRVIARYSPEKG